jgi:hypothetical protein
MVTPWSDPIPPSILMSATSVRKRVAVEQKAGGVRCHCEQTTVVRKAGRMTGTYLLAIGIAVAGFGLTFLALALLFRAQVRRYNRIVATEVLDDWAARRGPSSTPPAEVLTAMVALPSRGWRSL